MALKEYQLLYLDNDIPINRSFYCNNGDIKSRGLEVHVLDNSQAKDCTGLSLRMIIKVPSGDIFEATVENGLVTVLNAAGGIYQILFPDNMGKGRLIAEIQLSNAVPEVIVSRKFSLVSDGSLTSDGVISELPKAGILWDVIKNEAQRQADFQEVLNNTDVAVAEKFANLETEYATDLTGVKSQLAETQSEFQQVIANATVDSEVINARGGKANLDARLDEVDLSLVAKENSGNVVDGAFTLTKLNAVCGWNGQKGRVSIPSTSYETLIFVDKIFDLSTLQTSIDNKSASYMPEYELYSADANIINISARLFFSDVATAGDLTGFSGSNYLDTTLMELGKFLKYTKIKAYTKPNTKRYAHFLATLHCASKEVFTNFLIRNLKLTINGTIVPEVGTQPALYGAKIGSTLENVVNADFNIAKDLGLPSYSKHKWFGKKANFLGDSITYGVGTTNDSKRYVDLVKTMLGFSECRNYGISGTKIAPQAGNPTESGAFVNRYSTMDNDADLVVVFGITNDFWSGTAPLGTENSTNSSEFYGALNNLISGLLTKYPTKDIVFMTPTNQYYQGKTSDVTNVTTGLDLKGYRDAVIKRCLYYGIAVLDLFSMSGIDAAHNVASRTAFTSDGLHLNDSGNKRVAERLVGYLKTL